METVALRKIGTSRGILLKKSILEKVVPNSDSVEFQVEIKDGKIILSPSDNPHRVFEEYFAKHKKIACEIVEWEDSEADTLALGDCP